MKSGKYLGSHLSSIFAIIIIIGSAVFLVIGIHQLTSGNVLGYDFFYYWNTARLFSQEGLNPHSEEVAIQNQIGLYGRPAQGTEELSYFKNPIYSILFLLPFSWLPYDWAISVWIVFNILAVILCLKISFPNISPLFIIAFLFTYQVDFCLIEGNFSLLVGLSLIYVIQNLLFSHTRPTKLVQFLCGILLLIATFKPQFSWIFVGYILLYCLSRKYISVLASFTGCILILGGYMLFRFPTWPVDFIKLIQEYSQVNNPVRYQLFSKILPGNLTWMMGNSLLFLSLILAIYMIWRFFFGRKPVTNLAMISLLAFTTFIAHPSGLSYEQIVLLVPVVFWIVAEEGSKKRYLWAGMVLLFLTYLPFFLGRKYPGSGLIVILPFGFYLVWFLFIHLRPMINSAISQHRIMTNN